MFCQGYSTITRIIREPIMNTYILVPLDTSTEPLVNGHMWIPAYLCKSVYYVIVPNDKLHTNSAITHAHLVDDETLCVLTLLGCIEHIAAYEISDDLCSELNKLLEPF